MFFFSLAIKSLNCRQALIPEVILLPGAEDMS